MSSEPKPIKWSRREGGGLISKDGRFVIQSCPQSRRIPRWMVFEIGIGPIAYRSSANDAKAHAAMVEKSVIHPNKMLP